jgi:putative nucleotidyltransferase with HDIG domain
MDKQLEQLINNQYRKEHILEHGNRVAAIAIELSRIIDIDIDENVLLLAGQCHDIGKLFIPQEILEKPAALNSYEFGIIHMHPTFGYKTLKRHDIPENILQVVFYHHENFDGTGYNFNLKGEEIPLGARVLRICDTWDALTSERPYRKKLAALEAIEIMDNEQSKYDPDIYIKFKNFVLNLSTNMEGVNKV